MFKTLEDYRSAWDSTDKIDTLIPLNIDLELCSLCSLRCPFCFWGDSKYQTFMREKDYDGGPMKRMMPTDLAMRLIDEASAFGVPAMKFHGRGDGVHHPDYSKILLYARAKGSFLELLVNTHGNCGPEKIDGLMAADKVMLSLDSTVPERYDKMRVGGRFSNIIWTAHELLRRGHENVWVRRVITRENKDEPFVENCRRIFGPSVHVSEHFAFPGRNESFQDTLSNPGNWTRKYCQYPSQRLLITASGLALPCCVDWSQEMPIGNVYQNTLKEIWHGEPIRKLREELRQNILTSKVCQNCTSFQAYDRPETEFVKDVEGKAVITSC